MTLLERIGRCFLLLWLTRVRGYSPWAARDWLDGYALGDRRMKP